MRKEVTESELLEIINREIEKNEELTDCRISSVQWHEKDATGLNWSAVLRTSGVPGEAFKPQIDQIIQKIGSEYNLNQ